MVSQRTRVGHGAQQHGQQRESKEHSDEMGGCERARTKHALVFPFATLDRYEAQQACLRAERYVYVSTVAVRLVLAGIRDSNLARSGIFT